MQHLDNDMDELFNKAGQDYPLNTAGSDWESVRRGLYAENVPPPSPKKFNPNFYWLLILLLPLSWVVYNKSNSHPEKSIAATTVANNSDVTKNKVSEPLANSSSENVSTNKSINKGNDKSVDKSAIDHQDKIILKSEAAAVKPSVNNSVSSQKKIAVQRLNAKANNNNNLLALNKKYFPVIENVQTGSSTIEYANLNIILAPLFGSYSINNITKPILPANPFDLSPVSTTKKKKTKDNHYPNFYIGVVVGPDLSYIRSQKVNNVGYGTGITIGYRVSKHFAFEVGALYDQKKYFTKGKYFDKTAAGVPMNVKIAWLDGGCNMMEFPLLARYHFNIRKSSFFVSTGLTSYLMKKENYTYSAESNGMWYEGYRSYENSGSHIFSNMQMSLGFSKYLSRSTQIRIEPYIKIPVKHIGIGNMPVTSSGIYLGITHDLK